MSAPTTPYVCTTEGCSADDCPNCLHVASLRRQLARVDVDEPDDLTAACMVGFERGHDVADYAQHVVDTLRQRVAALEAERDELRRALDAVNARVRGEAV